MTNVVMTFQVGSIHENLQSCFMFMKKKVSGRLREFHTLVPYIEAAINFCSKSESNIEPVGTQYHIKPFH